MNEYRKQYPDIAKLFSSFFHQDWDEGFDWQGEAPNYQSVVRFYKTLASQTQLENSCNQLQRFLALPLSEAQIEEITSDDFRCTYYPPGEGLTYRQWLKDVLNTLSEPIASSNLRFLSVRDEKSVPNAR